MKLRIQKGMKTIKELEKLAEMLAAAKDGYDWDLTYGYEIGEIECYRYRTTYVAYTGDTMIGACTIDCQESPSLAFIYNLFVHTDYRRRGIATTLLKAVFKDYSKVDLQVYTTNSSALKLYASLDMRIVGINTFFDSHVHGQSKTYHAFWMSNWQEATASIADMQRLARKIQEK